MLRTRVATAAVLLSLLVVTILYGKGWPFTLLVGAAALVCAGEYFRMFLPSARDRWSGFAVTGLVYASGALLPYPVAGAAIFVCLAAGAFHFLAGEGEPRDRVRGAALTALGAVYIGGFFSLYPRTIFLPRGEHWVLLAVVAVASGDTFAYFVGRAFGKRRLSPRISPNKTVEGAAGGLAASVLFATAYAAAFLPDVPAWFAFGSAAIVGVAGQAGDLFESLLKRAADVKDSGGMLPGHGGLFDRSDSILAVGPLLHLLAVLSGQAGGGAG